MVIHVLSCISILYVNIPKHDADNGCFLYLINISCLLVRQPHRYHCPFKVILFFKVIPLKLFYYQTFFETWRNEHS